MPSVMPSANPRIANRNRVPSRLSSHKPNTPGRTISSATVMIRVAQRAATTMGARSSGALFTALASFPLGPPRIRRRDRQDRANLQLGNRSTPLDTPLGDAPEAALTADCQSG
jgi:hypothetical protein